MFGRIGRHVSYINVVLTAALVFAMSGGAYAANHYLITSTKQISPKVLKILQGKNGAAGSPGIAGAMGPKGETGAAGKDGPVGKEGQPGANGLTGEPGPVGKEGSAGKEGGFAETLPSGKTEKGQWAATLPGQFTQARVSISFTIPLAANPTPHIILAGEKGKGAGSGCPTTSSSAKPEAEPGNLCIFVTELEEKAIVTEVLNNEAENEPEENKAGKTGAILALFAEEQNGVASGTWAVTAK